MCVCALVFVHVRVCVCGACVRLLVCLCSCLCLFFVDTPLGGCPHTQCLGVPFAGHVPIGLNFGDSKDALLRTSKRQILTPTY